MITEINEDAVYEVEGYKGIAFRFVEWPKVIPNYDDLIEYDDDGNPIFEIDVSDLEDELEDDVESGQVYMTMIGDDRRILIDLSDINPLNEDDYCGSCGQVGCGWH